VPPLFEFRLVVPESALAAPAALALPGTTVTPAGKSTVAGPFMAEPITDTLPIVAAVYATGVAVQASAVDVFIFEYEPETPLFIILAGYIEVSANKTSAKFCADSALVNDFVVFALFVTPV
jgi:hypothetical protein